MPSTISSTKPEAQNIFSPVTAENRVILLTAPGSSAIAVLRILGPGTDSFLTSHFDRTTRIGRAVHGTLRDGDTLVDDPVITRLSDGCADVCLHGGPWVVRRTLEMLRGRGFEIVEQTEDALDREAIEGTDAIEQVVMASLHLARTEQAVAALLAQRSAWRNVRRDAFSEDDLRMILADRALWRILHPPRVAIVGAPNVGKSTLANQLFARNRSIVADLPGTTRDWVGELTDIDGLVVMLVDTPGVRATSDPIEAKSLETSRVEIGRADLVIQVLDASQPAAEVFTQTELAASCATAQPARPAPQSLDPGRPNIPTIRVANKTDCPLAWAPASLGALPLAARQGRGVDALRLRIREFFGVNDMADRPRCWTDAQFAQLRDRRISPDFRAV